MADEHLGQAIDITGWVSEAMGGARRHPDDTDTTLVLTLYDQEGEIQSMTVRRTRDMEMFQEWLRRFDRYTPRETSKD